MNIKRGKKGLSPVVTTVLLISLVVIVSIIIFLWARGFIKEVVEKEVGGVKRAADKFCPDVSFQASISAGNLVVSNTGNIPIYKVSVKKQAKGASAIEESEAINLMPGQTSGNFQIDSDGNLESYDTLLIIPVLLGKSGEQTKEYTCDESYAVECAKQADDSFTC